MTPDGPAEAGLPDALDDPRIPAALMAYLDALEAGARPDRAGFLAGQAAELRGALAEGLDGLDLIRRFAPGPAPMPHP